ncbi:hypothetical protein JW796_02220 [Candidatus Dojkabacteria bacterium]|nr:hypothetical protein [Candidatus Dojkabacteria bacterium]
MSKSPDFGPTSEMNGRISDADFIKYAVSVVKEWEKDKDNLTVFRFPPMGRHHIAMVITPTHLNLQKHATEVFHGDYEEYLSAGSPSDHLFHRIVVVPDYIQEGSMADGLTALKNISTGEGLQKGNIGGTAIVANNRLMEIIAHGLGSINELFCRKQSQRTYYIELGILSDERILSTSLEAYKKIMLPYSQE